MSTTYHNQKNPPVYKITHFTPAVKSCWCWIVTIPAITLSGQQEVIAGKTADIGPGITAWSCLSGSPSFPDRASALRWAELMQLPNVIAEIA
jgi:hypothetical protein